MEPTWARAPGLESHGGINERKSAGEKGSIEFAISVRFMLAKTWLTMVLQRCIADGTGGAASVLYSFQTCNEGKTWLLRQAA